MDEIGETLVQLVMLGAINHQITHIITTGVVFQELREWILVCFGKKLGYLVTCHLCCGTWIGLMMALFVYRDIPLAENAFINYFYVSFAIAFFGRIWNEIWALMSSKVSEIRAREACGGCAA